MFFRLHDETGEPMAGRDGYDLAGALALFSEMVQGLRIVHAQSDQHQSICLNNIRVTKTGTVEFLHNGPVSLAYISPEQTGRMNRQIDYRSDYYSLGIVMYELASGHVPFEFDSVMEQIHSHIAKRPLPPGRANAAIPDAVGAIILKLLAKNAEDRYQSLDGLLSDIERCRTALAETGVIEPFALAQDDVCNRLQISQKLYGRDSEYTRLLNAFRRVVSGSAELLLVTGYSGIGKSSLVNEIHKPVVAQSGYFISGKFDQFKRTIPYSAFNQAFRELMRQILTESENRIATWRTKLQKALGPNGQLIIDAIPELEFIIGKQPKVPVLGATRNSFNYVMQNFVSVFTHSEHPIVLFLDDLQWADAASLKLISLLMKNLDDPCLLLIGAYRDNEVDITHPLNVTIDQVRKDTAVTTIEVSPLSEGSIAELIADTLHRDKVEVVPLARLIYRKTMGNPFFIGQFIKNLHAQHLLQFDNGNWQWDLAQIEASNITDNVVDLLTTELRRLPAPAQRLLTIAACIGSRFDFQTLETVSEASSDDIIGLLRQAIQAGLILPAENMAGQPSTTPPQSYQFQHDKVQQAAYEGMLKEQADAVHLQIGRLLLSSLNKQEQEERIFDIVDHLNQGRNLLTLPVERNELADLNLTAAKKARLSAAFDVHRECVLIADEFGSVDVWTDKQLFMHELYMELINAAFARADYREMERLCQIVCDKSAMPYEIVAAKDYLIRCYGAIYKPQELMKTGLEMLEISGIQVPDNLGEKDIFIARMKLKMAMRGRDPLELAHLPPATDTQYLLQLHATMAFLAYGFTYLAGSKVVLWVALEIVRRSIRYGSSPLSAYAYAVWGRTLAGKYGNAVDGYKFGKVASQLGGDKRLLGAVGIFHGIIRHRREHFRLSLEPLLDTYVKAMEIGDRPGAMVALSFSDAIRFQSGGNVRDALGHMRKDIDIYRKMDYAALLGVMIPWAILFAKLTGEDIDDVTQGREQEDYALARKNASDPWGVFYVRTIQSVGELYFGDYTSARSHAEEAIGLPGFEFGTPSSAFLMWAHSLASLALIRPNSTTASQTLRRVKAMQRRFKSWADNAPMNYRHKWLLIEAERHRVAGRHRHAEWAYEEAIKGARDYGFPNDEALSHELAGKYFLGLGKEINARMHLEQAHVKYEDWGAHAKARQLEELYPVLLARVHMRGRDVAGLNDAREQAIDVQTLIRASQTLSGEIHLEKLLSKLMLLLIENAGAQKGALMLIDHDNLLIQAEVNAEGIAVQQALAVEKSANLSLAIVNYVKRTREKVVLGDAENDSQFGNDAYIEHERPKSILCLPLQKQGQLVGILYLENNLAVDAFTSQHAELLQMLSTQIAISLENAMLYNDLEQKIEARTQALSQKNTELSETLNSLRRTQKQLVESAKLASLGQLVAGVAHEINTPVGVGVTGASTLAEETTRLKSLYQTGEMKRSDLDAYVGTATTISKLLLSNMERAATLIQSFKDVAVDQTSEERRLFRMKPYIDEVLSNLSPMLRRSDHRMSVHCDEAIEVDTYPGALAQVITNFVTNALLHAFPEDTRGEMIIVVRNVYANRRETDQIELRFSDNGIGIPQENLARIFDPFYTTMRGRGGSGLGLNIIHNLVTGNLRGQIAVESQLNVGTTFIVRFPRNPANAGHEADAPMPVDEAEQGTSQGHHV